MKLIIISGYFRNYTKRKHNFRILATETYLLFVVTDMVCKYLKSVTKLELDKYLKETFVSAVD